MSSNVTVRSHLAAQDDVNSLASPDDDVERSDCASLGDKACSGNGYCKDGRCVCYSRDGSTAHYGGYGDDSAARYGGYGTAHAGYYGTACDMYDDDTPATAESATNTTSDLLKARPWQNGRYRCLPQLHVLDDILSLQLHFR